MPSCEALHCSHFLVPSVAGFADEVDATSCTTAMEAEVFVVNATWRLTPEQIAQRCPDSELRETPALTARLTAIVGPDGRHMVRHC
jgi:hypothetical protein